MRSRGNPRRVWTERTLRGAAFALLAWAMWRVAVANGVGRAVSLESASVESAWPRLLDGGHDAAHLTISRGLPADSTRDVLAAFAHAGVRMSWSGPSLSSVAMSVERVREPDQSTLMRVVGAGRVVVRDGISVLDSVGDASRGLTIVLAAPQGVFRASGTSGTASAVPTAARALHPVLVVGRASWETKFTVAALEEQGWTVESRVPVAPGVEVTTGTRQPLDTAHYAAVVALDSAAAELATSIVAYVRSGGGLVLLSDAARLGTFAALVPATVEARQSSTKRSFDSAAPLASLGVTPLSIHDDAVALDVRGVTVAVAARRERAGRVVVVGYDELWRWRLEGGDDAVVAHRRWWSRTVGAVAAGGGPAANAPEGAPIARWIDALGPATTVVPNHAPADPLPPWLLLVLCSILLAEWGSRRTRGAR
jgi:hypothetical protein